MTMLLDLPPARPDFSIEDHYNGLVCGIDEVGRGPLAGPVVAAAVILKRDETPEELLSAINDSKKLTAAKRASIFDKLKECAYIGLAEASVEEIDSINILQASLLAMRRAHDALTGFLPQEISITAALIDGNKAPEMPCATRTVIKGDSRSLSIAAASIIAKHHRDQLMKRLANDHPHYGWEKNAGYGTAQHMAAVRQYGITEWHRRSFTPISQEIAANN